MKLYQQGEEAHMNENNIIEKEYEQATGKIGYNMTNDYMFRVILQQNKTVLRGLVRSLLRLKNEDIDSVEVTNPILLGEDIIQNPNQQYISDF